MTLRHGNESRQLNTRLNQMTMRSHPSHMLPTSNLILVMFLQTGDAVLRRIVSGETSDPNGYSTDGSGNVLVHNDSESYEGDLVGTELLADGLGLEAISRGIDFSRGKGRCTANTQYKFCWQH